MPMTLLLLLMTLSPPVFAEDPGAPSPAKEEEEEGGGRQGGGRGRSQAPALSAASSDVWYWLAAAGGVCLLGVGVFWFRGPRRGARLPEGVAQVSSAPVFGAGTPPLDTGASLWLVAAPDRAALTAHLARAVADRRPVLVQAPADLVLDAAARGPLFRASFSKPEELHDAAYDLETPHPALALVIAVPEGEKASEWAREVSEDFPVLLVVARGKGGAGSADGGTTAVDCAREGDAWSFQPQPK